MDTDQSSFIVTCYNVFDNAMVPEGTSQVVLVTMKYADAWLKVPPAQYYDEKCRCAEAMLNNAEKVFPGLVMVFIVQGAGMVLQAISQPLHQDIQQQWQ